MDSAEHLMPQRRHRSATGIIAFAGVCLVLVCWAAAIGRYGGPDEPAHVLRAHAVAHGDLLGAPASGLPPGYRTVTVPPGLGTGDPACYRHDPARSSGCAVPEDQERDVSVATSAGTNPPLYYALVGLPPRMLGRADDPLAYRLSAVALVAGVLGMVVARLRPRGHGALVVPALVPPSCWFLWSVVNPNALEIALVALAATGIASSGSGELVARRSSAWWVSLPLAMAVAIRPIAFLWALTVLVLVELHQRPRTTGGPAAARRRRSVLWGPVAAATLAVVAWSAWVGLVVDDARTASSGSWSAAIGVSIGGLPRTGLELVASMGWLEYWAPWFAVAAWAAAAAVTAATRPHAASGTWMTVGSALILVPVSFEVVLHERVGHIWQGRYSLPVAAIAIVLALTSDRSAPHRVSRFVAGTIAGISACAVIVTFWALARRYAVGVDGSWWFHGADRTTRWLAPGSWVIVHTAVVVLLVGLLARGSTGEPRTGQTT